jgi:hypothetical protein
MPGQVLTSGATVLCMHGGTAMPTTPLPRVKASGQPAIGQSTTYTVAGCPLNPASGPPPCVSATWVVAATRVTSGGVPLVLVTSTAVCVPTGTGLQATPGQTRVSAT